MSGIREIQPSEYRLLYDNGVNLGDSYEISVVTPNYNRGKLLENMLASLVRQKFDLTRMEMLVVDDGGEAKEIEAIRAMNLPFRLRYFWQEHQGRRVGRIRNIGIKNAQSGIVLFLDSDALCSPSLLREHHAKHRRIQDLVFLGDTFDLKRNETPVFGKFLSMDSMYTDVFKFLRHYVKREFLLPAIYKLRGYSRGLCFCTLHASAKREHLLQVNGFDESLDGRWGDEDLELGYRLEKMGLTVKWSGSSFVYHQWHPIQFNIRNVDNRLRILLKHPEIIPAQKIGGLDNPFRICRQEDIEKLDRHEAADLKRETATPVERKKRYQILFDNRAQADCRPEISLVVPNYNRQHFLKDFLAGVEHQSLDKKLFEVIIADDGSNDGSLEAAKSKNWSFRLIYVRQERNGCRIASNRNNGVDASSGRIIVMADVDALLPRQFLEAHYQKHQTQDRILLIGLSHYLGKREKLSLETIANGNPFPLKTWNFKRKSWIEKIRQPYLERLARHNEFSLGTCMSSIHCSFKRADFDRVGGFDEDFDGIWGDEDIELGHRLTQDGVFPEFFNETIVYHRWHEHVPSRKWCGENRLIFLIKHQEMLKHRIINNRVNPYFRKTISDLRCFYLWAKRLRLMDKTQPESIRLKALREYAYASVKILFPAGLLFLRSARKEKVPYEK